MVFSNRRSPSEQTVAAVIVFIVFLVAPLCMGLMYYNTGVALKQQAFSQLKNEEDLAASAIQVKLKRLTEIASSLAALPQVVTAVNDGDWKTAAATVRDAENGVSFYDPFIDRFVFFDKSGTEQAAYPMLSGGIGADVSSTDWFAAVVRGTTAISSVVKRTAMPSLNIVNIAVPVRSGSGIPGVLSLQIPANNFLDFGYALSMGTYGFTCIVDQKGNVVAHPKYSDVGIVNLASTAPVKEILTGQSGTMITADPSENQINFLVYSTIPKYNWGIVIQEPYHEVFAAYENMMHAMEFTLTLLIVIDLLLSYCIFRYVRSKRKMAVPNLASREGFTLIELLVVIAVVAILSIVVVLTINPAEMLRQSRDAQRISDLNTLKSALNLYLVDSSVPNLASSSAGYGGCYLSSIGANSTTSAKCGVFVNTYTPSPRPPPYTAKTIPRAGSRSNSPRSRSEILFPSSRWIP